MSFWSKILPCFFTDELAPPTPQPVIPPALVTPPPPQRIRGIDISRYDPSVDWNQVKAAGYQFVHIKATEGETLIDDKFRQHWKEARANGILRGAYCFYHPLKDPMKQASLFNSVLGEDFQGGDLPPVLDIEWADGLTTLNESQQVNALICLEAMERFSGVTPWIYTNPNFLVEGIPQLTRFPLWLSAYTAAEPKIPKGWNSWLAWQYSDHEAVPGIGKIDASWFNGSLEQLMAMAKK